MSHRAAVQHLRRALCAGVAASLVALAPGAGAGAGRAWGAIAPELSRVRVLAVAPFLNDDPLTRPLTDAAADQLAQLLRRAPFQIVGPRAAAAAMTDGGMTPQDLISPSRSIALARRLGADAVLTGRVIEVEQGRSGRLRRGEGDFEAKARIDFRVLDVATRLKLFEEEVGCAGMPLAVQALECVVQALAARLLRNR
jgi:hypothetical protein